MSLDSLIARMELVADKCGDPRDKKKKEQDEAAMDEFTRLRRQIAREVKETRQDIERRNELLGETSNTVVTAKQSAGIRTRIKEIEADVERLGALQKKAADKIEKKKTKGKKVKEEDVKEAQYREEIVDLCLKHIAECKHMEKSGFGNLANSFFDGYTKNEKPVESLPDIDDDDFKLLRQNDAQIDQKLDLVSQGVQVLNQMAVEMGNEIQLQGVMLNDLDKKVDETQATLDNLNRRLKKTLEKVRKADRFCIDIILVVIVLALAGYIYNLVKK